MAALDRVAQVCVTCGKAAPDTATNYTLISAQHGWRLTRSVLATGDVLLEWRCPSCWQAFKEKRGAPTTKGELKAPAGASGSARRPK